MNDGISGGRGGRNLLRASGEDLVTIHKGDFEAKRILRGSGELEVAVYFHAGTTGENALRSRENVLQEDVGNDSQLHLTIHAAEGEVVDLVAKGRDVGALGGIHVDHQNILAI